MFCLFQLNDSEEWESYMIQLIFIRDISKNKRQISVFANQDCFGQIPSISLYYKVVNWLRTFRWFKTWLRVVLVFPKRTCFAVCPNLSAICAIVNNFSNNTSVYLSTWLWMHAACISTEGNLAVGWLCWYSMTWIYS